MMEITYEINDKFYAVTGDEKLHHQLQNDSEFCNEYFASVTKRNYSEIGMVDSQGCQHMISNNNQYYEDNKENSGIRDPTPSTSTGFQALSSSTNNNTNADEFKWTRQLTLLLLSLYKEKSDLFRNSKIKNKDIWSQILKEFKNKGYTVTIELLDRKFRNLKKTYKDNKDKKKSTGESSITWEYFDTMDEIFFNDKTINPTCTISSMAPVLNTSKNNLNSEVNTAAETPAKALDNQENQELKVEKQSESENTKVIKAKTVKQLYDHRKKIREIENQRLEEVKKLRGAIERNNEIQQERNEILRQMLPKN